MSGHASCGTEGRQSPTIGQAPNPLSSALAAFGQSARKAIDEANNLGDLETADIFTEISRGIDKWLWFVEAHLQAER
jgi:DNA-binding ferritin-like protein